MSQISFYKKKEGDQSIARKKNLKKKPKKGITEWHFKVLLRISASEELSFWMQYFVSVLLFLTLFFSSSWASFILRNCTAYVNLF